MGLDNGFILRHNESKVECEIAYFRKYYELDTWIRQNTEHTEPDELGNWVWKIDKNALESLKNYIKPIYDVLILVESGLINKYDDEGYPKSLIKKLEAVAYDNSFNPISSESSFAGCKLIHLYQSITQMLEIIDNNKNYAPDADRTKMKDWSIEFYSSF